MIFCWKVLIRADKHPEVLLARTFWAAQMHLTICSVNEWLRNMILSKNAHNTNWYPEFLLAGLDMNTPGKNQSKDILSCSNALDNLLLKRMITKPHFWLWSCIWLEPKKSANIERFHDVSWSVGSMHRNIAKVLFLPWHELTEWPGDVASHRRKVCLRFLDGTHKNVRQAKPSNNIVNRP